MIDIDLELKKLSETNKIENKVKACLFTLIVYTRDDVRGDFLRSIVKAVVQKLPCRLISIKISNDQAELSASVKQYSSQEAGSEIVCDHIAISSSTKDLNKIPYVVTPQIVPDLPVYLIWGEDTCRNLELLKQLSKYASRVIFDIESVFSFENYCENILDYLNSFKGEVTDISWALLSGWREALYQVFDTEVAFKKLQEADQIHIHYNSIDSTIAKQKASFAVYLAAWIASCLKLNLQDVNLESDVATLDYKTTTFKLIAETIPNLAQGAILSLDIKTKEGELFQFVYKPLPDRILVHISSQDRCFLPLTLPFLDVTRGLNFIDQLFYFKTPKSYKLTMQELLKISQKECFICQS